MPCPIQTNAALAPVEVSALEALGDSKRTCDGAEASNRFPITQPPFYTGEVMTQPFERHRPGTSRYKLASESNLFNSRFVIALYFPSGLTGLKK